MMAAGAVLGASRLPTLLAVLLAGLAPPAWGGALPPLHQQQQRRHQESLGACPGLSLSPSLLEATVDVVRSAVPSRLHVVVQGQPDSCLVESLWAAGVGVQVAGAESWWAGLANLTYLAGSQHLLVGQLTWLIHTMMQVRTLYRTGQLNAVKTRWIWVATDVGETHAFPPPSSTRPPPMITFSEALERFSDGIVEGMRGVLVARASRKQSVGPLSALQHDVRQPKPTPKWVVVVGGVKAPGDGRWYLRLAATYTTRGGLDVSRDLWPPPSSNLSLRTVRIACIKKPMVFEFQDGGGGGLDEAGGYIVELMRVVRQRLNFTAVLVATQGFGLLMANGSWNGMVGVLQRREADMAALDFTPSWRRTQVVDFSRAIGQDEVVIISRAPAAVVKPFLLLQIFSPLVWACLVGVALSVGVVLGLVWWAETHLSAHLAAHGRVKGHVIQQIVNVLRIHVNQGSAWWPGGGAGRTGATAAILVALVVASVYSGSITAFLAIPFRSAPLDSVEDLVRSEVRPALRSRTLVLQTLTAAGGALAGARRRVAVFTGAQTSSRQFFAQVADGTYALVDVYSSAVGRANRFERRGDNCKFHLGRTPVKVDLDVMAFLKNSPILQQVDHVILRLRQHGIVQHIKQRYYSVACEAQVTSRGPRPMSLLQVQGALYLLVTGLLGASLCFLAERLWHRLTTAVSPPPHSPQLSGGHQARPPQH